ncbi:MAG: selenide, water dikinase SelD [Nitrospirae bacterium RBG_13_39_12]|nr:MAG: selenide, water dikinase SelD [Nitrospirae bacterium RBG_13_39_12]
MENIISSIRQSHDDSLIVGPGDDAGVYMLSCGQAIVESVDIITPVVNTPFLFGSISAVNSVSDIYAMGGKPLTALALVGFPSCDFGPEVVKEILKGAISILDKIKVNLIGGHTFEDPELKFGLSVTGTVDRNKILRQRGSNPGDVLVLTKPIGIGILTTALKARKLSESDIYEAIEWMLRLNDTAAKVAVEAGATSATDVTGFGLLGHAYSMVRDSSVNFIISRKDIPVMSKTEEMIDAGMVPEGAYNNLKYFKGKVEITGDLNEGNKLLLADPQTSGGLLLTLPQDKLDVFRSSGEPFYIIGRVEEGRGKILVNA